MKLNDRIIATKVRELNKLKKEYSESIMYLEEDYHDVLINKCYKILSRIKCIERYLSKVN